MVKELSARYEEKCAANEAAKSELQAQIIRHIGTAEALEKKAAKERQIAENLRAKLQKMPAVDWKQEVIEPLAEELAKRTGKKSIVVSPRGIGAKVTIILIDDPIGAWITQDRLELTVEPDFEDGRMVFDYETEAASNRYEKGTLGEPNGLNNVTERLPDSVDEIMGLLKFIGKLM